MITTIATWIGYAILAYVAFMIFGWTLVGIKYLLFYLLDEFISIIDPPKSYEDWIASDKVLARIMGRSAPAEDKKAP